MAVKKDYYKVLGVDKKADVADIKRAFKRLAMRSHPDVNKEPGAKERFIEINEAYAVLSDADQRRKYDLGNANPFAGYDWGSSRSSSSSSSSAGRRRGYSGAPTGNFDFDAYWERVRKTQGETTKDIDDSFSKIFDDLFTGAKKARRSGTKGGDDSLLDDFGDFLETMLGVDELGREDSGGDADDLAGDKDALRLEISDAEFVVKQLQERASRLQQDSARAEATAEEWDRKATRSSEAEEKGEFLKKAKALQKSAARLRQRSKEVSAMQDKQQARLTRLQALLQGKKSSSSSSKTSSSSSSSTAEKVVVSCTSCSQKVRIPGGVEGSVVCPACGSKFRAGGAGGGGGSSGSASSSSPPKGAGGGEKVVVGCPSCKQQLRVPMGQAGSVSCPKCRSSFGVDEDGKVLKMGGGGGAEARGGEWEGEWDRMGDEYRMREELRKARVDEDLDNLKKDMGKR